MRVMTMFLTLGPIFEALATSIGVMCVGRLVSGIGAGAAVVVVPIYISEIAPPKEKGLFGALTQIMINVGILLAQLLGYFLSKGNLWRIILAVSGAIGVLQFLALWLVPESPKWLAEHQHPQRAREILRKIRGRRADLDEEVKCWNIDSSSEDIGTAFLLCSATDTRLTSCSRRGGPSACRSRHSSTPESQSSHQLHWNLQRFLESQLPTCRHRRHCCHGYSATYRHQQYHHVQ